MPVQEPVLLNNNIDRDSSERARFILEHLKLAPPDTYPKLIIK